MALRASGTRDYDKMQKTELGRVTSAEVLSLHLCI